MKKAPWYIGGLAFECTQCGNCCSGPGEGVIWVTQTEIELIADFLKMPVKAFRGQYLHRVGARISINEDPVTKDCVFLETTPEAKRCTIYPVRPNQCRTWPFWASNLSSAKDWNEAAQNCPGMDHGPLYTREEIDKLKKQRSWWKDDTAE